ncbi:MAG: 1-acyl-sn-glycerol-3-phosphate acyltransferase [Burkholderiaceae bacterium]
MITSDFVPPFAIQFKGNSCARWVLRRLGWQLRFDGLPALQGVFAVYPHTSNWDFVVLVLVKWASGVPVRFWAKDKLFSVPVLGRWLRLLGGVPVERNSPHGLVGQTVKHFADCKSRGVYFWLAVAPEGTRKATPGWRSGFYQATVQAQVPLCLVKLDYAKREVTIENFIALKGEPEHDFARIKQVFEGVRAYRPRQAAPVRLLGSPDPDTKKAGS